MGLKYYIYLVLFFTLIAGLRVSCGQSYGLAFASNEVVQDKRTGLDLSPGTSLCFKEDFALSFDLSFLPNQREYFGYIVRLIDGHKRNIDLLYDYSRPSDAGFKVVAGGNVPKIVFGIDEERLFSKWNRIRMEFNSGNNTIVIRSGMNTYSQSLDIKKGSCYKILFGANTYEDFKTTDVPPMKIRNIRIAEGGALKFQWLLDEEEGEKASESTDKMDAKVENPLWIRKMHHDWRLLKSFSTNGPASVAFDAESEIVYISGLDSLYSFTANGQLSSTGYSSGRQHLLRGNQSLYDSISGRLYNIYPDQQAAPSFDFRDLSWGKNFTAPAPLTDNWQFNKFYSHEDTSLYVLGGYGHFKYKNQVKRYRLPSGPWETIKTSGDFFTPRYLAALGSAPGGAYVLGGYGSPSGRQILNPGNLYDLVYFNTREKSFRKVYELQVKTGDFVFANSLVIDEEAKAYYGLIFPKNKYNSALQLIKGSLTEPRFYPVGNEIPYLFHDVNSFADLYYCPVSKRFYAVTLSYNDKDRTLVSIYSLSGPPMKAQTGIKAAIRNYLSWRYLLSLALVAGLAAAFLAYRKKQKGKNNTSAPENTGPAAPAINPDTTASAIFLFGDLQLFDPGGLDITRHFTPLIKELFLVVLLYTIRWERGISSEKLKELLWFDKTVESARNNRSVNIAKLKSILDKMQYCQISKETGYWKINIDHTRLQVDYYNYLSMVRNKGEFGKQKIEELSHLIERGSFLSNTEYEWLDPFKSEISNEVVDTFLGFAHSIEIPEDPEFLVKIADYIFFFDSVNEEAMALKCRALAFLGKHSLAKTTFENFNKEYKAIYGEEFGRNFHSILGE